MDIKKYEGSISIEELVDGLLSTNNYHSFGDIWEKCITCNNCKFRESCRVLSAEKTEITCAQVIDLLLGDLRSEDIKENK